MTLWTMAAGHLSVDQKLACGAGVLVFMLLLFVGMWLWERHFGPYER